MGTKVHYKSNLHSGYYSMRDLNEDSSSCSWPNGQYYNGFVPRTIVDSYPGYEKDVLKQKMLEHEAVFKNQVYELHRLYQIQRDMMEEVKRKEMHHRLRVSMEPSSSSNLRGSQIPSEDPRKWHMAGFPLSERTPVSCAKRHNTQPFQNGSSEKDSEPLDSRALKVRKKLFDLELPAHEYIDTEEGEALNNSVMTDSPVDKSASGSRLRNSIRLADLNEPVEIEEATAPSFNDFPGHSSINGEAKGVNQPAKSNAGYLGVQETGRLSYLYEPGSSKSNLGSINGLWQNKLHIPSHPVQHILSRVDPQFPIGHSREDPWKERNHHGLESSSRSRANYNNGHFPPLVPTQTPGSDLFFSSSCFPSSWPHSGSTLAKSSFTQKITAAESCLYSNPAMGRSFQTSGQSQDPFGGKWQASTSSRLNPNLGGELTIPNGFYHGSASGTNEHKVQFPSAGYDQGFGYCAKGSGRIDSRPVIDLNLNEVVSSNEETGGKSKPDEHLPGMPWLKCKPSHANDTVNRSYCKTETVTDLNQPYTPEVLLKHEPESHVSTSTIGGWLERKGVDKERKNIIIDINLECEPEETIAAEELIVEKEKSTSIRNYIDLNSCVSDCEDPPAPSYESKTVTVKKPLEIDLEAPIPLEDEDDNTLPKENTAKENTVKNESILDEVLRDAAETMFAISSACPNEETIIHPSEPSSAESLLWFAELVSSCTNELTNDLAVRENFTEEMDDFEAMTLQLQEMKEEDYMPVPFVPETQAADDVGPSTLPTRSRRGQSRRGRQRRDFQRDILPGLTSLSRHEVTEDLQTFGGLMKATGHNWVSGLARRNGTRNGSGRGRRRATVETVSTTSPSPVSSPLIQQLSNIEGGLEDRSLTGWGKTTRRPRRQRCPAGNPLPPAVVLT